mmetsp:Transcript_16740/g.51445  ORF Transcript_16740/g.51445 Transcript_16740/m.51445 type:complete len:102 (+) Transcript_16740:285-590(+)
MGVPPEVLEEVGAAGEGAIRLRGDLRSAMADLEAVLTQSQYTALANPLKLLVARFEKRGSCPATAPSWTRRARSCGAATASTGCRWRCGRWSPASARRRRR